LDLHKRYIAAYAVDATGRVIAEARRLATDPEALLAFLAPLGGSVM
jgi:hypothetical protein